MVNGNSYHVELNARGDGARLGVTTQEYGRVYRPPVASDHETDDSGNGEEETKTKEADVRCFTSLLRASVSADSLIIYYPDPVVPYSESSLSSCHKFDVHDSRTVISMYWFGDGRTSGGERWDFDLLEIRINLRVVRGGSRGDDGDENGVPILVDAVSMDRQQMQGNSEDGKDTDEDPFGFDLLPGGSDGFFSVLLHGPGGVYCTDRFTNLSRDLTLDRTRVRRRGGGGGQRGRP